MYCLECGEELTGVQVSDSPSFCCNDCKVEYLKGLQSASKSDWDQFANEFEKLNSEEARNFFKTYRGSALLKLLKLADSLDEKGLHGEASTLDKIAKTLVTTSDEARQWGETARWTSDVSLIKELALDDNAYIRAKVAQNSKAPADVLDSLAREKNVLTRKLVAHHLNTSSETLAYLSNDHDARVRYFVATNINTSNSTLLKLKEDDNIEVSKAASQRLYQLS